MRTDLANLTALTTVSLAACATIPAPEPIPTSSCQQQIDEVGRVHQELVELSVQIGDQIGECTEVKRQEKAHNSYLSAECTELIYNVQETSKSAFFVLKDAKDSLSTCTDSEKHELEDRIIATLRLLQQFIPRPTN